MITGHEEITAPLTDDELSLIPVLIKGLSGRGKLNPITNEEICRSLKARGYLGKKSLGAARLRKLINYIRGESKLPVLATKNGYFCSHDPLDIKEEIESLEGRVQSLVYSINGLKKLIVVNTKQTEIKFDKTWPMK
jgi:hypothetical protein